MAAILTTRSVTTTRCDGSIQAGTGERLSRSACLVAAKYSAPVRRPETSGSGLLTRRSPAIERGRSRTVSH
jgi:hypothetical protein